MRLNHLIAAFFGHPWAVLPEHYQLMKSILLERSQGVRVSQEQLEAARTAKAGRQQETTNKGKAIILPLHGTIIPRMYDDGSGTISTERFGRWIDSAVNDPTVSSIIIDIDSPGGCACGVQELAAKIRLARDQKSITAVAHPLAASAAYWIGSAANEFVMVPSGFVGSIGVFMESVDLTGLEAKMGVKTTLISAGKYKTEGHPSTPLTEQGKAAFQSMVDTMYRAFVEDVAKNRKVSVATVEEKFGQGRVLLAEEALKAGMVDRIGTLESVLETSAAAESIKWNAASRSRELQLAEAENRSE